MKGAFAGELAHLVPRHVVEAGARRVDLARLPHRLADAAIRATALAGPIRSGFEALAAGDATPLARLGPTSLVYGVWDSRDTRISAPRAISSRIEVWDKAKRCWLVLHKVRRGLPWISDLRRRVDQSFADDSHIWRVALNSYPIARVARIGSVRQWCWVVGVTLARRQSAAVGWSLPST